MSGDRRALVTGVTGFIGRHLVRHLHAAGWQVHALVRGTMGLPQELSGTHVYSGETEEVLQAVKESRPDVTFHLASLFLASHGPHQLQDLVSANVLLGTQLLEALAEQPGAKFVNTGTSWQYFHSDTYRPTNLYAATKQAFQDILAYFVDARQLNAVTLSLFDSYGAGDTRKKLVSLLLDAAESGAALGMSGGKQIIDLVHVDDMCRGFLRAADLLCEAKQPASTVYALCGERRRTLQEIAAVVAKVSGRELHIEWGARPYREREVMQLWDGPKLPGWSAQITLEEGITELLQERRTSAAGLETAS